jgi:hypothetical protein
MLKVSAYISRKKEPKRTEKIQNPRILHARTANLLVKANPVVLSYIKLAA